MTLQQSTTAVGAIPPSAGTKVACEVTVVIATYSRPDALVCAVQSVLLQTLTNWQLLIIGDACDPGTLVALEPYLMDRRIRFVNLPWRCGEQAMLNSAGIAAAQSEFIAFLNQDDLWLPSHLEIACRTLRESGHNFFMARTAWTWWKHTEGVDFPVLHGLSPEPKEFLCFFTAGFHYVEPVSSWVVSTALAHKVGPWKRSIELFRQPIQDWALRSWRVGAELAGNEAVTCIKFENQWVEGAPKRKYDADALEQQLALETFRDAARLAGLMQALAQWGKDPAAVGRGMQLELVSPELKQMAQALLTSSTAHFYKESGLDAYAWLCAEAGLERGERWRWALDSRTGEKSVQPPESDAVVNYVAHALESGKN